MCNMPTWPQSCMSSSNMSFMAPSGFPRFLPRMKAHAPWQLMRCCRHRLLSCPLTTSTHPASKAFRAPFCSHKNCNAHVDWPALSSLQTWKEREAVISCYRLLGLWKITWSGVSLLSFQTALVWTDLWVITLWKEVCIFLIANEHFSLFFSNIKKPQHAEMRPFITSVNLSDGGGFPPGFLIRTSVVRIHAHVCGLLSHFFIYFSPQNLQWARDVLLGSSVPWQQLKHMPAQGLFCERNKTNLFNVSQSLTPLHVCRPCRYVTTCCFTRFGDSGLHRIHWLYVVTPEDFQ